MISLGNIVALLMLVLCICLAVLVAYLISKVNELELKTSNILLSNQTHKRPNTELFAGLQGKQLWDAWQVVVTTSVDELGLDRDRDRFMMLLELHVRELVKAGRALGNSTADRNPPRDTIMLKTLRGDFESHLPMSFAENFFNCGMNLGSGSSDEQRVQAVSELESAGRKLGAAVLADEQFAHRIASFYL